MATVSRFSAVAKVGPLEFGGSIAWLAWLMLHLVYLVGFKSKITTVISWTVTFLSTRRSQLAITEQQAYAAPEPNSCRTYRRWSTNLHVRLSITTSRKP